MMMIIIQKRDIEVAKKKNGIGRGGKRKREKNERALQRERGKLLGSSSYIHVPKILPRPHLYLSHLNRVATCMFPLQRESIFCFAMCSTRGSRLRGWRTVKAVFVAAIRASETASKEHKTA